MFWDREQEKIRSASKLLVFQDPPRTNMSTKSSYQLCIKELTRLTAQLKIIPREIRVPACCCSLSAEKWPCTHPHSGGEIRPNREYNEIAARIAKLNEKTFCKICGAKRINDAWLRCPWCSGHNNDWIEGPHLSEPKKGKSPTFAQVKETLRDLSDLVDFQVVRFDGSKMKNKTSTSIAIKNLEENDYKTNLGELWLTGLLFANQAPETTIYLLQGLFGSWPDNVFFLLKEVGIKIPDWFWDKYAPYITDINPYKSAHSCSLSVPEKEVLIVERDKV